MASLATSIPLYLYAYALFLTDLCSSGVINYDEERAKLCSRAGIVGRNCTTSELILIGEALPIFDVEKNLREAHGEEIAKANKELGKLALEKVECEAEMESIRDQMKELDDSLKELKAEICMLTGQLKSSKLSDDAKKELDERKEELESKLKTETETSRKEIRSLRMKLPPKLKKNSRTDRILSRKHFWKWALEERKNNRYVKKIWKQVEQNYAMKPENFQAEKTIEEYVNDICEGFAELQEEVSVKTAYALFKFEMPEGYEFEYLPIYKDETIDKSMLILVNAIGLSIIRSKADGTLNKSVTGITIPGSVTRKA